MECCSLRKCKGRVRSRKCQHRSTQCPHSGVGKIALFQFRVWVIVKHFQSRGKVSCFVEEKMQRVERACVSAGRYFDATVRARQSSTLKEFTKIVPNRFVGPESDTLPVFLSVGIEER